MEYSQYNIKYQSLVRKVLQNGIWQEGRNGMTIVIPHYSFTIDDMQTDHILRLRKMYTKGIIGEFNTLIDPTPLTNVLQFEANGCNYWSNWSAEDGSLRLDYHDELVKQLPELIRGIQKDPNSRRHILSLWNSKNVFNDVLSLPCCWTGMVFSVINNVLHLRWEQRSCDTMVGLPSDVYLAYLFMNYVALKTDLIVGSCMFSLSNVHIYEEHVTGAKEILNRNTEDYDKPIKFELKE